MTTVTFDHFKLNNVQPPLTIEEIFRHYGNWSGIHDFNFDDLYALGASNWSGIATLGFASGILTVNATASATGWYDEIQDGVELPTSYAIYYHKVETQQAIVISKEVGETTFLVGTDSNGYPFVQTKTTGAYATAFSIPVATPQVADVVIGFRQLIFTDDNSEVWVVISMWMNDKLYMTYLQKQNHVIPASKFGVGAYGGSVIHYQDLSIPELTEFAEWGSLDPGESSLSGLNRVLEGRYLKFFVRQDGSLRAWRPKTVTVSKALNDDVDLFEFSKNTDIANVFPHIRMIGAYLWAESFDADLIRQYGHKFREENNPMLFTERECSEEAERTIRRYEEQAFTEQAQTYAMALLEPEDRVTTANGDWIISSITHDYEMGHVVQRLALRKYVWGS